ncbi:hypothetical protein A1O7_07804 [Cladophialophora yegresii CBS 114405]|uniref:USP domain-containing protein n=1 Tax=Cladophialophora yegresii CBS 114405 TaxID=1182544 RepID=W9VYX5_9EURO|nr:uncharacterized protein A1O7_07804 [Cladophialophora yegresii CBS 114405]EXJ57456.1 hypothetical protein A1O7_07804 [Cladophialophora yegresii CBS 114405]
MAKKKPSKASRRGASAPSANQKYWSSYSIDKLIQQCKSRQIPVPPQKLKRQEYVDKIEESLAKFGDKGPRDWNKLTVEDLKNECSLRNIDITGLKKQGLVEKLEKGNPKTGIKEPAGPRQTATQTSNDQQNQRVSSANADKDYDNWDYRTRLLPAWKTLGIKSRKAVDIIQALKDRDKEESSQGGGSPGPPSGGPEPPAGAPEPPPRTPEQPADKGTSPAASGNSPRPAGGQHGATAGGTLASPTSSTGSAFHRESAPPDPTRPVETPLEALEAARSDNLSQAHGIGLSNPSHLCYRNVLFIMLLHCNRILSWIENRHIPNLENAGFALQIKQRRDDPLEEDERAYTDIWCEFLELANVYWRGEGTDQSTIDRAMRKFWSYVTNDNRQYEVGEMPNEGTCAFKDQTREHDVPELFEWLVDFSVRQLDSYLTLHDYDDTWRITILNRNVKELMTVYQSVHYPCSQRRRVKHRKSKLEEGQMLRVNIPPGRRRGQQNVTLEQCLEHSVSFDMDACACAPRSAPENNDDAADANQTPRRAWSKMWYTPEVLFVQLKRFKEARTARGDYRFDRHGNVLFEKDNSRVEIPEELDLAPFLEERGQAHDLSSKYTLVGIISHQGTRDGGHYITNVRRGDDWHEFDDDSVKKTSLKAVLDQKRRFTPYVILYERIPEEGEREDVNDNTHSNADNNEHDDAYTNASASPSARGDGRARNTRNPRANNAANRVAKASNRGNKLDTVATNNNRSYNHVASREALHDKPSLFTTPYVQSMLASVFNKLEKYFRKEVQDEVTALQQVEDQYREANTLDILTNYFIRREADMLATQQEQAGQIDRLECYAAILEDQNSELMSIVDHVDPAALIVLSRKRGHEEIYDGESDLGEGLIPPSKRSRRNGGHTSSMDVRAGSDYDAHGMLASDGLRDKLQHTNNEFHGADGELPDCVTSEEEVVDGTDSQSASMSLSEPEPESEPEDVHEDVHESEAEIELEAAPESQIDASLLEEAAISEAETEIDYTLLMRERNLAKRAFADDYAAKHSILRLEGQWSWMGPRYQQDFEAQLAEFVDGWEAAYYENLVREKADANWRNNLGTEEAGMPPPSNPGNPDKAYFPPQSAVPVPNYQPTSIPAPVYTPRSPRYVAEPDPTYDYSYIPPRPRYMRPYTYPYAYPYTYRNSSWRPYTPADTDDSPSRRFYTTGKDRDTRPSPRTKVESVTPGARGLGLGVGTSNASPTRAPYSARTTIKRSPQSAQTRTRIRTRTRPTEVRSATGTPIIHRLWRNCTLTRTRPTEARSPPKTPIKRSPQSPHIHTRTPHRGHSQDQTQSRTGIDLAVLWPPGFRVSRLVGDEPGVPAPTWDPVTPEDQSTWYTPPRPRRSTPRPMSTRETAALLRKGRSPGLGYNNGSSPFRVGPQFGRIDLNRVAWPRVLREEAVGESMKAEGVAADWW